MTAPPKNRLRIAHVTNYQVPEYGYDEIQLSREQRRMGHDVTIITSNYLHPAGLYGVLRRRFPERQVEPREEVVDGVRIQRLQSREIARRVWIQGMARSILEFDPDVVHIHNLLQFHPARMALLRGRDRYRGAILVDDHMHRGFMRRSPLGRLFYVGYRHLGQPVLEPYVDRFSAIADDTRDYLRHDCGVKGEITVVPLGVDTETFAPDVRARQEVRDRLGISQTALVLLYTGKVIPEKGVHILVQAAANLTARGRDVWVVVVGDSDETYEQELRAVNKEGRRVNLHIEPSVEQDRLPQWYAAGDIGVWPRQESKAVFEAMAAGLPVVVSASSGLAHIVSPERGLTYSPEQVDALAASLETLLIEEARRLLGDAGRRYASSELSWTRSAERYVLLYREAIARRGSPTASSIEAGGSPRPSP